MASGNEHVNMGLVVRIEGPYTAIASQKGPQQCCILGRVLQMDDLGESEDLQPRKAWLMLGWFLRESLCGVKGGGPWKPRI